MQSADFDIQDLIPQRPPMVMIDKLTEAGEISATGELKVHESNLFCENGLFRETGLIEFIAQTAAAFTGYRNKIPIRRFQRDISVQLKIWLFMNCRLLVQ